MTEIAPAMLAFFLWGLSRGLTTCLFLCAPGMIPVMVNERAGMLRSLWLGLVLSLPRILLLTVLGAAIGLASFEVARVAQVRGALWWTSLAAYAFLGLLLVGVGARLLGSGERREGARRNDKGKKGTGGRRGRAARVGKRSGGSLSPAWGRFWAKVAARVYPASGRSDRLFLLWGGVLSLACLAELGLLEGVAVGTVSGVEPSAAGSAGLGAALMLSLSLGATIPIMAAAAVGGGLVERVRDRRRLDFIKRVMAMLMVLLGLYFIFSEAYTAVTVIGWY